MRRIHSKDVRIATRNTSRSINRQIVLSLLRGHQPISRAALARLLGMQRSAVGLIVNDGLLPKRLFERVMLTRPFAWAFLLCAVTLIAAEGCRTLPFYTRTGGTGPPGWSYTYSS